jgi:hypothetical protein
VLKGINIARMEAGNTIVAVGSFTRWTNGRALIENSIDVTRVATLRYRAFTQNTKSRRGDTVVWLRFKAFDCHRR